MTADDRAREDAEPQRTSRASDVDALWPVIHECLHQLAAQALRGERNGHTLQPTALVHEAWLRLSTGKPAHYNDTMHFQAVAARALREVLVDHARRRAAEKRGGSWTRVTLSQAFPRDGERGVDVLALEEAMCSLTRLDARAAKVVELMFFGGMTLQETATALEVSKRTVSGDWQFARAWLMRELSSGAPDGDGGGVPT